MGKVEVKVGTLQGTLFRLFRDVRDPNYKTSRRRRFPGNRDRYRRENGERNRFRQSGEEGASQTQVQKPIWIRIGRRGRRERRQRRGKMIRAHRKWNSTRLYKRRNHLRARKRETIKYLKTSPSLTLLITHVLVYSFRRSLTRFVAHFGELYGCYFRRYTPSWRDSFRNVHSAPYAWVFIDHIWYLSTANAFLKHLKCINYYLMINIFILRK